MFINNYYNFIHIFFSESEFSGNFENNLRIFLQLTCDAEYLIADV